LDTFAGTQQYGNQKWVNQQYLWVIPLGHCTGDENGFFYPQFEVGDPQVQSIAVFKNNYSHPVFSYTDKLNFYTFGPVPLYLPNLTTPKIGNYWVSLPAWPKPTSTNYYLRNDGTLSNSAPTADKVWSYNYDPKNPTPAIGANTLFSSTPCGPRDQTSIESRADVLKWTSSPFSTPLAFCGKLTASLNVISSAIDTDFYVTLTDVYPDGGPSVNIRYGAQKMRWRNSPYTPSNLTPGTKYTVTIDMWTTSYILNAGHALRVLITSSRHPEFSVNPNNGCDLYTQDSCPTIVANNTVLSGPSVGLSFVTLPVVPLSALPENTKIH